MEILEIVSQIYTFFCIHPHSVLADPITLAAGLGSALGIGGSAAAGAGAGAAATGAAAAGTAGAATGASGLAGMLGMNSGLGAMAVNSGAQQLLGSKPQGQMQSAGFTPVQMPTFGQDQIIQQVPMFQAQPQQIQARQSPGLLDILNTVTGLQGQLNSNLQGRRPAVEKSGVIAPQSQVVKTNLLTGG